MFQTRRTNRRDINRRGATAVEFALVVPIVFLFFFGLWEWSRVEMVRQVTETAAFDAAREGILPGRTVAEVEAAANLVLDRYFVKNAIVTSNIGPGNESASISIVVPLDSNTWITSFYYVGKTVQTNFSLTQ